MSTAPNVTAEDLAPRLPLDATIAYACESLAFIDANSPTSACYPLAIAAFFAICAQACHTGILPMATRNHVDHGLYSIGAKTPRERVTTAQARVNREYAILYAVAS